MGRSVSYPSDAYVAYSHIDSDDLADDFDWLVDDLRECCAAKWKSFSPCDKWLGREDHAVLKNTFAYVGISEYCGLVAYWIVVRDDLDDQQVPLAERWVASVAPYFTQAFSTLNRLGTFSNGEGVFERIEA